ncbi:MAG: helix-turn-helix transcriptional regulator [Burkholderiaceae bacterium]
MQPVLQPVTTSRNLGWMLLSVRKSKKLTQSQLASRVGVSQSRISHLEQHPEELSVQQLMTWCSALGLELSIGAKGSSTPPIAPAGKPAAW